MAHQWRTRLMTYTIIWYLHTLHTRIFIHPNMKPNMTKETPQFSVVTYTTDDLAALSWEARYKSNDSLTPCRTDDIHVAAFMKYTWNIHDWCHTLTFALRVSNIQDVSAALLRRLRSKVSYLRLSNDIHDTWQMTLDKWHLWHTLHLTNDTWQMKWQMTLDKWHLWHTWHLTNDTWQMTFVTYMTLDKWHLTHSVCHQECHLSSVICQVSFVKCHVCHQECHSWWHTLFLTTDIHDWGHTTAITH